MTNHVGGATCPVCNNRHDGAVSVIPDARHGGRKYDCPTCGEYVITDEAREDYLEHLSIDKPQNLLARAALSHVLRSGRDIARYKDSRWPLLDSNTLERLKSSGFPLPTPLDQAQNLIRIVGDHERSTGQAYTHDPKRLYADIGAANIEGATNIAYELAKEGFVSISPDKQHSPAVAYFNCRLSLKGWRLWDSQKHGNEARTDGFIAMQFGNERLDSFIKLHVETDVAATLGVRIRRVDSPDIARAGVIDNIMREAIADAAFVIVELSHGNRGAYWEAGYAEGLGKSVIYICEQSAWSQPETRPHFDVNHCTTVMWDEKDVNGFKERLIATIRNSIRTQTALKSKQSDTSIGGGF